MNYTALPAEACHAKNSSPREIEFELARAIRQHGPNGIEYSEAPLDPCNRMANPLSSCRAHSLSATSGVAGRYRGLPTVTFSVCEFGVPLMDARLASPRSNPSRVPSAATSLAVLYDDMIESSKLGGCL